MRTKSIVNSCSLWLTAAKFAHTPAICSVWSMISGFGCEGVSSATH